MVFEKNSSKNLIASHSEKKSRKRKFLFIRVGKCKHSYKISFLSLHNFFFLKKPQSGGQKVKEG